MNRVVFGGFIRWALAILLIAILVNWALWPALRLAPHVIPRSDKGGAPAAATVPMFNAWTIWWNAQQLSDGFSSYWDAPIFFPEQGTFAFSEPQPATCALAPIVWLTSSPIIAYYAYLAISLVLNGVFTLIFLRSRRVAWLPSVACAVAVVLHPMAWDNIEVIQLVPLWGILWAMDSLIHLSVRPTFRRSLVLALSLVAIASTSIHHLLLFSISALPSSTLLLPKTQRATWLSHNMFAAILATTCLLPIAIPMYRSLTRNDFKRTQANQALLSADLEEWYSAPQRNIWTLAGVKDLSPETRNSIEGFNPGWGRCGLAAIGIAAGLCHRRGHKSLRFLAAVTITATILSFGANLHFGQLDFWQWLVKCVPPLEQVRTVHRFGYYSQLAILLLAAIGIQALHFQVGWLTRTAGLSNWSRWGRRVILAVSLLILAVEVPPPKLQLLSVPDTRRPSGWIDFIRANAAGKPILCLPLSSGYSESELETSARWMLYSTQHGAPLLNGYSGYFPRTWFEHIELFQKASLDDTAIAKLRELGVRWVVIDTRLPYQPIISDVPTDSVALAFSDALGIQVWDLERL